MRVTPKTDEELSNVWNAGWYPATIENAVEGLSKNNAEMLTLTVKAYDNDTGRSKELKDYIVDAVAYKVKHACEACGLIDDYNSGHVDPQKMVSVNLEVKLGIEQDKTGAYPDKNKIIDYRATQIPRAATNKPTGVPVQQQRQAAKAAPDSDIPFSFIIAALTTLASSLV